MFKSITILALLFSFSAQADVTYFCTNKSDPKLTYTLFGEGRFPDIFTFTVKRSELVPGSCLSRWGCDYVDRVVTVDQVEFTDMQGAYIFESKRSYIGMEDPEDVSYHYTYRTPEGTFASGSAYLSCKEEE